MGSKRCAVCNSGFDVRDNTCAECDRLLNLLHVRMMQPMKIKFHDGGWDYEYE